MPVRSISELYSKHRNTPGVIVGNGGSLEYADFNKLNAATTLCCNSKIWNPSFYSMKAGGIVPNPFKPKYVVFSEEQTYYQPSEGSSAIYAENGCNLQQFAEHVPTMDFYKFFIKRTYLTQSLQLSESPNWANSLKSVVAGITDKNNGSFNMVFGGMSTVISIAFWMGFNPIYLVGLDGGAVDGRFHFWAKPGETTNIYNENSQHMQRTFIGQMRYLHVCKQVYASCGVDLLCATKGSKYLKVLDYAELP